MSAPIVWILCGTLLFFSPPMRVWRNAIAAGAGAAVLAYLPAIYWELTHGFENTIAILTKGGGSLDLVGLIAVPFRVFGYAVLYGTSEIGYHFQKGYWSPFDESKLYGTLEGWRSWFELHGVVGGLAGVVSILVGFLAWGMAAVALKRRLRARKRMRSAGEVEPVDLGDRLTLGLVLGLLGGMALMMISRKPYFPHYTNLLMPIALWPIVSAIDSFLESAGKALRSTVYLLGLISVAAMASSSIRYYRTVDALNGLDSTVAMVDEVMKENTPIVLEFEGFQNGFAWQMLANVKHRRPLEVRHGAPVRYRVKNRTAHQGSVPAGASLFDVVLLERIEMKPGDGRP
jgi:hypothetical protein